MRKSLFILVVLICFGTVFIAKAGATNNIEGVRVWPAPENTRLVFDLSGKPDFSYFSLSNPAP